MEEVKVEVEVEVEIEIETKITLRQEPHQNSLR